MHDRSTIVLNWSRTLVIAITVASGSLLAGCGGDDEGTKPPTDNVAPAIDSLKVNPLVVAPGDTAEIACFGHDANGDELTYAWQPLDGTIVGSGAVVRWASAPGTGAHAIIVTVTDGQGGSARDTTTADVFGGTLLVQSRDGLTAVNAYGESFLLSQYTSNVEILGTHIFIQGTSSVTELDHLGNVVQTIESSNSDARGINFSMLPGGGFAFLSNELDTVHFVDPSGTFLETVAMPDPSPDELQNVDGVVVGNRLIVSDNGNHDVLAFDLTTREASIFRSFHEWSPWLGAIDYADGTYFLCDPDDVRYFTEEGEVHELCTLPAGNITGIAVVGSYAYAIVNFSGTLYRIDARTGEYTVLRSGLDYPQDIEYLPVALTPPGGAPATCARGPLP
jgi:hypothetical protein